MDLLRIASRVAAPVPDGMKNLQEQVLKGVIQTMMDVDEQGGGEWIVTDNAGEEIAYNGRTTPEGVIEMQPQSMSEEEEYRGPHGALTGPGVRRFRIRVEEILG